MNEGIKPDQIGKTLEQVSEGKFIKWREKRGDGWSETRYSGLAFEIDGIPVIVSKLSHGLRVLPRKADAEYSFEGDATKVEIPSSLIEAARAAFATDREFQKQIPNFEKAVSGE